MLSWLTGFGKSSLIMGGLILLISGGWWFHTTLLKADVEKAKAESTRLEGELSKANAVISLKDQEIGLLKTDVGALEIQVTSLNGRLEVQMENLKNCRSDSSFLTEWCSRPRNVLVDKSKCEVVDDESYKKLVGRLNDLFERFNSRLFQKATDIGAGALPN